MTAHDDAPDGRPDDRTDDAEVIARVVEIMRDHPVCMLTTVTADGSLTSRPMTVQQVESRGDTWLFARAGSPLAIQVEEDPRVNLGFAGDQEWVSVAGHATVEVDAARAHDLWDGVEAAWFDGPEDPDLRLLHVRADSAQFWDAPGRLGTLVAMARAAVTDQDDAGDVGDSRAVEL